MAPSKVNGLNNPHTAGIFSDMTVDGPEIGTLVVIVDRAKNLPNRKTIGKQDPYCAARLGKEAKKTETDRRGGQTPRWDQELRYTVHDSPDYYQLKVSVFNDDKKTDLIGETWIDLKEIVVPGGGQNDVWHTLNCRGKYAGEIRIEITYYDTRPKPERPERVKQAATNGAGEEGGNSLKGPRQPKASTPVKRRPLPSDPVTGAPPPNAIPDHVQTPPRGYNSPAGTPEYPGQRTYQTPPRGQHPNAVPIQLPSRGHPSPIYIPNQSPLQNVEYNTAPPNFPEYDHNPSANGYMPSTPQHERQEIYDPLAASNKHAPTQNNDHRYYEHDVDSRDTYDYRNSPYDLPLPEDFGGPPSPGGPPPPPPAHRSRHGSSQNSPAPVQMPQRPYGYSSERRISDLYDVSPTDFHSHSMPHSPSSHRSYGPQEHDGHYEVSPNGSFQHQQTPPRHHSYDSRSNNYGSMQPTVEDAPPSPSGHYSGQSGSASRSPHYEDRRYDQVPSPAPLNLSNRGSTVSSRGHSSSAPSHQYSNSSMGYQTSNSDLSYRDQSYGGSSVSSRSTYSPIPPHQQQRKQSYDLNSSSDDYSLPPVPATLVPGMDPMIAQEISDRIYDEKRASRNPQNGSGRGRHDSVPYQPAKPHPLSYQENATPFVPAAATYDERQSRFSTATVPVVKPRAISPDPRVPARKSVSPSPGPSDGRRLSGVPFGPDSYNALNPKISGSTSPASFSAKYDPKEPDPSDAKIITHDGREIDPSDHLPESTYAPLRELKTSKPEAERQFRPSPTAPQQQSSSGRRPLKVAPRPHSMSTGASPMFHSNPNGPPDPVTPTGRNRLQKKTNRMSAQPAPHSSPLAPITPYQNNYQIPPQPGSLPRANTGDFGHTNENYGYRNSAGPPPIPAKVPMGGGAPPQSDAWALLEEMKNIDLGGGRSRRRGY